MKKLILQGHSTYDGAGVKLKRIFAHDHTKLTDPFLLLDHFGSDNPDDYVKGFPWHPHRGIETVTYMLGGTVEHGDNIGNAGTIGPGDIQWMTAGGGVIHQEMPQPSKGMMHGLQLWVNLPAKNKMMEPRYRGILENEVPVVKIPGGEVRVIAGAYKNVNGPVQELVVDIEYLDVWLKKGMALFHAAKKEYTSFCYLISGTGEFDDTKLEQAQLILFTEAGSIAIKAIEDIHYIFVTGKQLNEPIAWGGPIVMNTQEELEIAFRELDEGTFIKKKKEIIMSTYQIAVVVGSLRKDSFNRKLANAIVKLAPPEFSFQPVQISDLPLYNQDDDANQAESVKRLKNEIKSAQGFLFVTPEYNRSIPGVLKNAIDNASRPPGQSAWTGKPAGIFGVSNGPIGTAMAQQHLRNILAALNVPTLCQPEAFIQLKDGLFDEAGNIGADSKQFLQNWMNKYVAWVKKHAA